MYTGGARRRLSHLWQLPLLLLSLALFAASAGLYFDTRPTISLNQKLAVARQLLHNDRPDAAAEYVSRLMATADEPVPPAGEGRVHLLLAEALDAAQKQRRQSVPANHLRIVEQTQIALAQGVRPTGDIYRRLGESYEALGKPVDAVSQYRQAIAVDPARALRLQRKVIDLQLAQNDWAPAESSLDAYLAFKEIADSERAWAQSVKAQLHIDRGDFTAARALLDESLRLDKDPIAQAEAKYRLGVCAWKLGSVDDAVKLITAARGAFRGQHPLDAEAAYTLGRIALERKDLAAAVMMFEKVIAAYPDSAVAPAARLGRGLCRVQTGDDDAGAVADLQAAAAEVAVGHRADALVALQKSANLLASRRNYQAAITVLAQEQAIEAKPPAEFHGRLAAAYEKRAGQVEQSIADAAPAEKLRREHLARQLTTKAAEANLSLAKARHDAGEREYGDALWKAMDLFDWAGDSVGAATALEQFMTDHAADALAPDALLRLARTYESSGQSENAISAYHRLRGGYTKSLAAAKAAIPLAALLAKSPQSLPQARRVLAEFVDDPASATRTPDDYRAALLDLGRLCFRGGELKEAAARLEHFAAKFPRDERSGEVAILWGECYRAAVRSEIEPEAVQLASSADERIAPPELERAAVERKQQLMKAAAQFGRAAEFYAAHPPTDVADRRYQMLAELRRADCAYELGDFAGAVASYQVIATRWPDDEPVTLAACVQIVNAYRALNRPDDARTANERVRALLAKMPRGGGAAAGGAFADSTMPAGGAVMDQAYWEQWLKWAGSTASTW